LTLRDGIPLKTLLAEADADVEVVSATQLGDEIEDDDLVIIDLRDIRELTREGHLPGAVHMPRGMLEFWIAPESPYARPVFQEDKRFVFYCAMGWRSALACQVAGRLGLQNARHLEGGFGGWKDAGLPVVAYEKKQK
jgi:rhodanese-related sulfurtransferase